MTPSSCSLGHWIHERLQKQTHWHIRLSGALYWMKDYVFFPSHGDRRKHKLVTQSWAEAILYCPQTTCFHKSQRFVLKDGSMRLNLFKKGADAKYQSVKIQMCLKRPLPDSQTFLSLFKNNLFTFLEWSKCLKGFATCCVNTHKWLEKVKLFIDTQKKKTFADNLLTPMSSKMSMSFFLQSKRN